MTSAIPKILSTLPDNLTYSRSGLVSVVAAFLSPYSIALGVGGKGMIVLLPVLQSLTHCER